MIPEIECEFGCVLGSIHSLNQSFSPSIIKLVRKRGIVFYDSVPGNAYQKNTVVTECEFEFECVFE